MQVTLAQAGIVAGILTLSWVVGRPKEILSAPPTGNHPHQVFNTTSKAHAEKVASLVPDSIVKGDSGHPLNWFVMSKTPYAEARSYYAPWLRENDYFRSNQFLSEVKYEAESFEARGTWNLYKSQEKLLKAYRESGGKENDYDSLPIPIVNKLENIRNSETLWSDVNRWLSDNPSTSQNPYGGFHSSWDAESFTRFNVGKCDWAEDCKCEDGDVHCSKCNYNLTTGGELQCPNGCFVAESFAADWWVHYDKEIDLPCEEKLLRAYEYIVTSNPKGGHEKLSQFLESLGHYQGEAESFSANPQGRPYCEPCAERGFNYYGAKTCGDCGYIQCKRCFGEGEICKSCEYVECENCGDMESPDWIFTTPHGEFCVDCRSAWIEDPDAHKALYSAEDTTTCEDCEVKIGYDEAISYEGLDRCEDCYDYWMMKDRQNYTGDETDCISCGYSISPNDVRFELVEGLCPDCKADGSFQAEEPYDEPASCGNCDWYGMSSELVWGKNPRIIKKTGKSYSKPQCPKCSYSSWFWSNEEPAWLQAESKKLNPIEKPIISGAASGATIEGLEDLMMSEPYDSEDCPLCLEKIDFGDAYEEPDNYPLCDSCDEAVQEKRYDHAYSAEAVTDSELAELRTKLSKQRTAMSAMRTALAAMGLYLAYDTYKDHKKIK